MLISAMFKQLPQPMHIYAIQVTRRSIIAKCSESARWPRRIREKENHTCKSLSAMRGDLLAKVQCTPRNFLQNRDDIGDLICLFWEAARHAVSYLRIINYIRVLDRGDTAKRITSSDSKNGKTKCEETHEHWLQCAKEAFQK